MGETGGQTFGWNIYELWIAQAPKMGANDWCAGFNGTSYFRMNYTYNV